LQEGTKKNDREILGASKKKRRKRNPVALQDLKPGIVRNLVQTKGEEEERNGAKEG